LAYWRWQQQALQNSVYYDNSYDRYYYQNNNWNYRLNRNGSYYQTNGYGVALLRQAVNRGYEDGVQAGQADQYYGQGYDPDNSYQSANYGYDRFGGYNGYRVDQNEYEYYYREGFRRGYEDGYNSNYQYGGYNRGINKYAILGAVLQQVLNLNLY
jgi:hypothetical protein